MISFKWGMYFAIFALVVSLSLGIISGVKPLHLILRSGAFSLAFFGLGIGARTLIDKYLPELLEIKFEEPKNQESFEQGKRGSLINITVGASSEYAVPENYKELGDELGNIEDLISGKFKPILTSTTRFEGVDRKQEADYNKEDKDVPKEKPQGVLNTAESGSFQFEPLPVPDTTFTSAPAAVNAPEAKAKQEKQAFSPALAEDESGLGGLPDLDQMAKAFSSSGDSMSVFASKPHASEAEENESGGGSGIVPILPLQSFEEEMSGGRSKKSGGSESFEGDFNPKELAMGIRTVLSKDK